MAGGLGVLIVFAILAVLQPLAVGAMVFKRLAANSKLARFKFTLTAVTILAFYLIWYYVFQSVWVTEGVA